MSATPYPGKKKITIYIRYVKILLRKKKIETF